MLLPVLLLLGSLAPVQAGDQCVRVTGQVLCDGYPYSDVRVQLWEEDNGRSAIFDKDDKLDEARTDLDGMYTVEGHEDEFFRIKPYVLVLHRCGQPEESNNKCYKTLKMDIPAEAIIDGLVVRNEYTMNDIELSDRKKNSGKICF